MIQICDNSACTGCMACVNVCSHQAIFTYKDEEGFERPIINQSVCVNCYLCAKVCPVNHLPNTANPIKIFSGWSTNEVTRVSSSSGGAFTEIAKPILADKGVVFGCALNKELQAEHIHVETLEDLKKYCRGSKYVQSHIGKSYSLAERFLKQGRKVLFSGTPCQIAGLKNYLNKEYNNLLTLDLICHGVPSPLIFEEYKKYIERTKNMHLTSVEFRCKEFSWIFYNMTLKGHIVKGGGGIKTYIGRFSEDPFLRGFLQDYFLRPSCYQCRFATTQRCGDFTIADWWNYTKESPEDKDFTCKGVSLLFANSEKAISLLPQLNMYLKERSIDEAKRTNGSLSRPFPEPEKRNAFWQDYRTVPFDVIVSKYMKSECIPWDYKWRQYYKDNDRLQSEIRFVKKLLKIYQTGKGYAVAVIRKAYHLFAK